MAPQRGYKPVGKLGRCRPSFENTFSCVSCVLWSNIGSKAGYIVISKSREEEQGLENVQPEAKDWEKGRDRGRHPRGLAAAVTLDDPVPSSLQGWFHIPRIAFKMVRQTAHIKTHFRGHTNPIAGPFYQNRFLSTRFSADSALQSTPFDDSHPGFDCYMPCALYLPINTTYLLETQPKTDPHTYTLLSRMWNGYSSSCSWSLTFSSLDPSSCSCYGWSTTIRFDQDMPP